MASSRHHDDEMGTQTSEGTSASDELEPQRDDDSGLGIPQSRTGDGRKVLRKEVEEHDRCEEESQRLPQPLPPWQPAPKPNFSTWILLSSCLVLVLLLLVRIIPAVVRSDQVPSGSAFWAGFFLILVVVQAVYRIWVLVSERPGSSGNPGGLRILLQQRKTWRRLALNDAGQAQLQLGRFLKQFDSQAAHPYLNYEERTHLEDALQWLQHGLDTHSAPDWLEVFKGRFLSILDGAAKRRLHEYAVEAGLHPIQSWMPLGKAIVLLPWCAVLFRDLLILYGSPPTRFLPVQLLIRSWMAIHFIDDSSEFVPLRKVERDLKAKAGIIDADAVATMDGPIPGIANGNLVRRLGNHAIKLVQPIQQGHDLPA